jgi:hypothetical protein
VVAFVVAWLALQVIATSNWTVSDRLGSVFPGRRWPRLEVRQAGHLADAELGGHIGHDIRRHVGRFGPRGGWLPVSMERLATTTPWERPDIPCAGVPETQSAHRPERDAFGSSALVKAPPSRQGEPDQPQVVVVSSDAAIYHPINFITVFSLQDNVH